MKNYSLLFIATFFISTTLSAQYASLWFNSPRNNSLSFKGTIEDATAYCEVSGSHLKTDLYLTFSTKAFTGNPPSDSVELRMYFSLPQQSFVTDLWLWIENDTSIALLADRFKAQTTYNTIVGARKDPALLTKTYGDNYQLNIFPFTLPGKRKIKITYSSPLNISDSSGIVSLPYWLFTASAPYNAKPFTIFLKEHLLWKSPSVRGNTVFSFSPFSDTTFGNVLRCEIPRDSISSIQRLDIVFQRKSNSFANYGEKYQNGNEGTYRFVVDPLTSLGINPAKNILLLVDFDSANVRPGYTKNNLLEQITKSLSTKFSKKDSFNIIFTAKKSPKYLSSHWLPVDSVSIANIFTSSVNVNTILDTVNLSGLLYEGFSYAKKKGNAHSIILLASSDEYTIIPFANAVVDSISKIAPTNIKFYSIDNNDSGKYYYPANYYFYGNNYLYSQLATRYYGSTYRTRNNPGYSTPDYYIGMILENLRWQIEYFDVNVYLQTGFTYQNYFSTGLTNNTKVQSSVSQVGKFNGSFPLTIDITGFYNGKLYSKKIIMNDSDFIPADSNLNKVWANQLLSQFANYYYTRSDQAIELSLQNRILTYWTAFLALEKGQKLCDTCIGMNFRDGVPLGTNEKKSIPTEYEIIQAYPNPFNPSTTLKIRLPQNIESKDVTLCIFNILGQLVKTFEVSDLNDQQDHNFIWNGRDNNGKFVSSGVYLAVLTTPAKRYSVKLLLMK